MTTKRHDPATPSDSTWEALVAELLRLRSVAGNPSFGRIAQLITEARVTAGAAPAAARVARSTVYDTFTPGRPRINLALAREATLVLGGNTDDFERWVEECRGPEASPAATVAPSTREVVLLLVGCVALNMLGRLTVDVLHLPLYLDMWGTALAAVALGPWRGAAVGLATNLLASSVSGWDSAAFAIVNVAGGLIWGYGIRRFAMGRSLARYLSLCLIVALGCSLLAVPILVLAFDGSVQQGQDSITQTFLDFGNGLLAAVGFSNLITSAADKVISGFVALVVLSALPWRFRRAVPIVAAEADRA